MRFTRSKILFAGVLSAALAATGARAGEPEFTSSFQLAGCTFRTTGRNPFFVLEPGYTERFEGDEDGEHVRLQIRVLPDTITLVHDFRVRVVEERETHDDVLVEVSRNYFAFCEENGSVFYAGEDVDIFNDDGTVTHEGSWRHGVNGARGGLVMPGLPLLGARYFQEIAPGVALDRAEIVSLSETIDTPAGRFTHVLKTRETTPLEPGAEEFKWYAPGVGLIRDDTLRLTFYGFE
jgi:hypothetical protein